MTGILLIAIGNPIYGRLACVLAASIKHKSQIPITLIYEEATIADLTPRQRELFDNKIIHSYSGSPHKEVMRMKTILYYLTPYDTTLFLDVDCVICPSRSVSDWFNLLKDIDFAPYNVGYFGQRKDSTYMWWGEPEDYIEEYKIKSKLPQINSSFLWFKHKPTVRAIFDKAAEIWNSDKTFQKWNECKPDEPCFNIAMGILDYELHQYPFQPLYFYFKNQLRSKEYITDNYVALSILGKRVVDPQIIRAYNDFVTYYFNIFGFKKPFYYEAKTKALSPLLKAEDKDDLRRVYGFWHICMINHFEEIVTEQLNVLLSSGLYDKSEAIYVGCIGSKENLLKIRAQLKKHPKVKILTHKTNPKEYEFPTLHLLEMKAKEVNEQPFWGYYFHTKGVSFPDGAHKDGGTYWRNYMEYWNLTKWRTALDALKSGKDLIGANWVDNGSFPPHFSGNFWWCDSTYIKTLPEVDSMDKTDRYQAEFWSGCGQPIIETVNQTWVDYNCKGKFKPE